jgi:two-component system LytT family response regulator
MRVVIIDDEAKARRVLEILLEENCPDIQVVGSAANVPEGVEVIKSTKPDLVFLDIEMPIYSGLQLLDFFDKVDFQIIFITAHNEYAINAFRVNATDYLLKPLDIDQLIKAVEKAKLMNGSLLALSSIESLKKYLNNKQTSPKITIPVTGGFIVTEPDDILYLKADSSYTLLLMKDDKKHLISKNLKDFETYLNKDTFMRIHRSYIININNVVQYFKHDGGMVKMFDGEKIPISKDRKDEFLKLFGEEFSE